MLQSKIIPIFHYALKPTGMLLLGNSESIGGFADLFSLIDKKHKIYVRKNISFRPSYDFTNNLQNSETIESSYKTNSSYLNSQDLHKEADKLVINKYSPPGLLLNQNLEIIQFRGDTTPYLQPSPGPASLNLFKMAKETLTIDLHSAINRVKKENIPVTINDIKVKHNSKSTIIDIDILPIKPFPGTDEEYYLLFFSEKADKTKQIETPEANGKK